MQIVIGIPKEQYNMIKSDLYNTFPEENGEHIIGFGTYNPKVFSRYLREYFIAPTIIAADKESKE